MKHKGLVVKTYQAFVFQSFEFIENVNYSPTACFCNPLQVSMISLEEATKPK